MILKAPESCFRPAPEGNYPAVCVDIVDLGMVEETWQGHVKMKHKCEIIWELDEVDPETNERYMAKQKYTASLHEKGKLYKLLVNWRGRQFTPEELTRFDTETIIGAPCLVQIVHNIGRQGGVFANVGTVAALPKGVPPTKPSGNYTRRGVVNGQEVGDAR